MTAGPAPRPGRGYRAVSFDCYGTLIDWDRGIADLLAPWAATHGIAVETDDLLARFAERQYAHQRVRPPKLYRDVVGDAFTDLASGLGVTLAEADRAALAAAIGASPVFPDTLDGLRALKRRGLLIGVVSNVDNVTFGATRRQLGDLIDVVVTAEEVGAYKPEPAMFEALLQAFARRGVGKRELLHAAQSRFHDIAPANAIGLDPVWVDRRAGRPGRGVTMPSTATPMARVESLRDLAALVVET